MAYDNVTNIVNLWQETNTVTNGYYTYLYLLVLFIIILVLLSNFDKRVAFLAASSVNLFAAILLFLADIATEQVLTLSLVLFVATLFLQLFRGDN